VKPIEETIAILLELAISGGTVMHNSPIAQLTSMCDIKVYKIKINRVHLLPMHRHQSAVILRSQQ